MKRMEALSLLIDENVVSEAIVINDDIYYYPKISNLQHIQELHKVSSLLKEEGIIEPYRSYISAIIKPKLVDVLQ